MAWLYLAVYIARMAAVLLPEEEEDEDLRSKGMAIVLPVANYMHRNISYFSILIKSGHIVYFPYVPFYVFSTVLHNFFYFFHKMLCETLMFSTSNHRPPCIWSELPIEFKSIDVDIPTFVRHIVCIINLWAHYHSHKILNKQTQGIMTSFKGVSPWKNPRAYIFFTRNYTSVFCEATSGPLLILGRRRSNARNKNILELMDFTAEIISCVCSCFDFRLKCGLFTCVYEFWYVIARFCQKD